MYVQIEYKKQRYDFWGVKFVIFEGGHLNLTLYNFFEGILFDKNEDVTKKTDYSKKIRGCWG